jgi:hypothetical protein
MTAANAGVDAEVPPTREKSWYGELKLQEEPLVLASASHTIYATLF